MDSTTPDAAAAWAAGPGKRSTHTAEIAAIAGILLLAAVVRLAYPGMTEFKADEGRLLTAALDMAGGQFAVRGISSSVGFPNAPVSVWLYALPLFVWPHPYAATLFTGLLSLAAVAGTYWLARRYWGPWAAIIASLSLAVSPWGIVFSRKIWAQNLLPAFAVLWAISAALAFVEGRRWFVIVHIVCLAIAVQIHPAAIALFPVTLLCLIVFRRAVDWRLVIAGSVLAVLTAAPFLWYLAGRWAAEGGLPFSTGQTTGRLSLDSLGLALDIVTGRGLHPLAGAEYTGMPGEGVLRLLLTAAIVVSVAWIALQAARHWQRPGAKAGFIVLAWFLAPVLIFLWHRTPVYVHYFIASLPAAYIMLGACLAALLERARPALRPVAWGMILLAAVLQLASWGFLMTSIARQPEAGGFGTPLQVKVAAADAARTASANGRATEVILAGDGADPEQDDFPAEFRALLHGVPVRYADLNAEAVFPAVASAVLLEPAVDRATSVRDLYLAAGETLHEQQYVVLVLPASAAPAPGTVVSPPALLANFVRLSGHNGLHDSPAGALWDVFWLPADNPDPADYHLFNHLIDGAGARIAQADAAAFAGAQWRPGDVVISRFLLPLTGAPAPPLTLRVGMYRFPSLESVPVLDEAANPAGDAVTWPVGE